MPKINRSHGKRRVWLWHANTEPSIRNWSHADIRKTVAWSHHLPEDTCLSPPGWWPAPNLHPLQILDLVSTFQAFLTAISPSRFYGWVNRAKWNPQWHAGESIQNPIPDSLAWPFCLCDVPQVLKRHFVLKKKWERPFLTFCSTVCSPPLNGDGISTSLQVESIHC